MIPSPRSLTATGQTLMGQNGQEDFFPEILLSLHRQTERESTVFHREIFRRKQKLAYCRTTFLRIAIR